MLFFRRDILYPFVKAAFTYAVRQGGLAAFGAYRKALLLDLMVRTPFIAPRF